MLAQLRRVKMRLSLVPSGVDLLLALRDACQQLSNILFQRLTISIDSCNVFVSRKRDPIQVVRGTFKIAHRLSQSQCRSLVWTESCQGLPLSSRFKTHFSGVYLLAMRLDVTNETRCLTTESQICPTLPVIRGSDEPGRA